MAGGANGPGGRLLRRYVLANGKARRPVSRPASQPARLLLSGTEGVAIGAEAGATQRTVVFSSCKPTPSFSGRTWEAPAIADARWQPAKCPTPWGPCGFSALSQARTGGAVSAGAGLTGVGFSGVGATGIGSEQAGQVWLSGRQALVDLSRTPPSHRFADPALQFAARPPLIPGSQHARCRLRTLQGVQPVRHYRGGKQGGAKQGGGDKTLEQNPSGQGPQLESSATAGALGPSEGPSEGPDAASGSPPEINLGSGEEGEELSVPILEELSKQTLVSFGPSHAYTAQIHLKLAQAYYRGGFDAEQVLEAARKALQFSKSVTSDDGRLTEVMCMHLEATSLSRLDRAEEALEVLRAALDILDERKGHDHALMRFATHMLIGDTWQTLSRHNDALASYEAALEIQERTLGTSDERAAYTLRQVAEAYAQVMRFAEAEPLGLRALQLHQQQLQGGKGDPMDEALDRRLLAAIYVGMEDFERALGQLEAVRGILADTRDGLDAALTDVAIGDMLSRMGKLEEAASTYESALTVQRRILGDRDPSVAATYVSAADAYFRAAKPSEADIMCQMALRIFDGVESEGNLEVANALSELGAVYETAGRPEEALAMFARSLKVFESVPGQVLSEAGVESQMGILLLSLERHAEAVEMLRRCLPKLQATCGALSLPAARAHFYLGSALAAGGRHLAPALDALLEARRIAEHPDVDCGDAHNLDIYDALANAYRGLGKFKEALDCRQHILNVQQSGLGRDHPIVRDSLELLNEAKSHLAAAQGRGQRGAPAG